MYVTLSVVRNINVQTFYTEGDNVFAEMLVSNSQVTGVLCA